MKILRQSEQFNSIVSGTGCNVVLLDTMDAGDLFGQLHKSDCPKVSRLSPMLKIDLGFFTELQPAIDAALESTGWEDEDSLDLRACSAMLEALR